MVEQRIPIILQGGINDKKPQMKNYSKKINNNNLRGMNVKEKNDVKTTAALLRTK